MEKKINRQVTEREEAAILQELKWSAPVGVKHWARIFDVHPNTMRKWLRNGVIRNEQLSPRRWRVAMEDLPAELVVNVLWQMQRQRIYEDEQAQNGTS